MGATRPRVLLDASVLKHAVDRRIVGRIYPETVKWGEAEYSTEVTRWEEEFPHDSAHANMRPHLHALPLIGHIAKRNRVELLFQFEAMWEFYGLPKTLDTRGMFFGAPVSKVEAPIDYSRTVLGGTQPPEQRQQSFFETIDHERFLQLQKVTGANNPGPRRRNQLADAFHIWTAEHIGADYFLTTDLRLVKSASANRRERPSVRVIAPAILVGNLAQRRVLRIRDVFSWAWQQYRTRGRGREDHPLEQLLDISRNVSREDE